MKKIIFLMVLAAMISCSDNDNTSSDASAYYPVNSGSWWTYTVDAVQSGKDSLYSRGKTTIEGTDYDDFEARTPVFGLYTNLLKDSYLKTEGSRLLIQGTFDVLINLPVPVQVELDDLLILDPDRDDGDLLAEQSREISFPYEDNTITLKLTVRTEMLEQNTTLEVNGNQFNDVTASVIIITGSGAVSGNLDGTPVTIPFLGEQEILRMEFYFARDIGMVYSRADINLELSNTDLLGWEGPESISEEILQEIDTYFIALP